VADEPDAVLVAAIVDVTDAIEEEEPLLPPYWAKAGTVRAEMNRADAVNFCMLAIMCG
jgi:hypothetical protein